MGGVAKVSHRTLVLGSGTVTVANTAVGAARLVFGAAQHFFPGEQIAVGPSLPGGAQRYTISHGMGTEWTARQTAGSATGTAYAFYRTDPASGRARGSSPIVPNAHYYLYVAPLDNSGAHDWYTYIDSVQPIQGVHPYTKDQWTGLSWDSKNGARDADVGLVPDLASRLAAVDSLPPRLRR